MYEYICEVGYTYVVVYGCMYLCAWVCVGGAIKRMDAGQKFSSFVGHDFLVLTGKWKRLAILST